MIVLTQKQTGIVVPIVPLSRPDREGEFQPVMAIGTMPGHYDKNWSILVKLDGDVLYVKKNGKPSSLQPIPSFKKSLIKFLELNRETLISFFNREIDTTKLLSDIKSIKG